MRKLKRLGAWLLTVVMVIGMLPAAFAANISEYGERPFREGLKPALVDDKWNYINEQGEVVDLNRGRFIYVFDFFEGLAAVIGDDGVGYIDKTGKLVIPCQFCSVSCMGMVYTGYFKNGVATVFDDSVNYDVLCERSYIVDMGGEEQCTYDYIGQIDKTGKLVKPFVAQELNAYTANLISDAGYMPGQEPTEELPPKTDLSIYFDDASAHQLDNAIAYSYRLTNNTDKPLKGYYALLSYRPRLVKDDYGNAPYFCGQLHKFEVDLAPRETYVGDYDKTLCSSFSLSRVNMLWITFDSKAEQDAFFADSPVGAPSNDYGTGYYWIHSNTGADWMKSTLDITILPAK